MSDGDVNPKTGRFVIAGSIKCVAKMCCNQIPVDRHGTPIRDDGLQRVAIKRFCSFVCGGRSYDPKMKYHLRNKPTGTRRKCGNPECQEDIPWDWHLRRKFCSEKCANHMGWLKEKSLRAEDPDRRKAWNQAQAEYRRQCQENDPEYAERVKNRAKRYREFGPARRYNHFVNNIADMDVCMADSMKIGKGFECTYCGGVTYSTGKYAYHPAGDHIDADLKGTNQDGPDNWALACVSCNGSKSDRNLFDWLRAGGNSQRIMKSIPAIISDLEAMGKRIPPGR